MKVLVTETIAEEGVDILRQAGEVEVKTGLSLRELVQCIPEYTALVVRSQTKVTEEVITAGQQLKIIGRCGTGVDNIDVEAATRQGILVVNSPWGNTIAAAEHTLTLMLALSRHIAKAVASLRAGKWERKRFLGTEVYNKTLGIIGLGRIGSEVCKRAQGLGMHVIAYDPMVAPERARELKVELVPLEQLLRWADYVTLHVPLNENTYHLLGAEELALMKPTARLINCARGGIVDEQALYEALKAGRLAGAALDVWEEEPVQDSPLLELDNVLPTPHLGASTEEAQANVAVDVAQQVLAALKGEPVHGAVNLPALTPEELARLRPYLQLAEKLARLHAQLADGPLERVELEYGGDLSRENVNVLTRAFLREILGRQLEREAVNYVNALLVAQERGLEVKEEKEAESAGYRNLLAATVTAGGQTRSSAGTVFAGAELRLVRLDGYRLNVPPEGLNIVFWNIDRPGVIGRVGTILGNAGINIAGMQLGREQVGGQAVTVLNVDDPVPPEVLAEINQIEGMLTARLVDFGE